MFAPFKAFKSPVILDVETHKDLKIAKPYDYSFMQDVETVPLTFSELFILFYVLSSDVWNF